MATTGERFEMPDGSVYIVRRPAAEPDRDSVEMEFVLPSACVPPPPHIHPEQLEEYEVLEGRFDVVVEGEWRTLAPGASVSVPIGALHTFRNRSGEVVRVRNWHRPAMRFEEFIQRTCRTLQAAGIKRNQQRPGADTRGGCLLACEALFDSGVAIRGGIKWRESAFDLIAAVAPTGIARVGPM